MALNQELVAFVKEGLARGLPRHHLQEVLLRAGWPADHVSRALAAFAEADFPIPVPRPTPYASARDAFVYGTLFVTLATAACSFGDIVFELINRALPDPAIDGTNYYYRSTVQAIRWSLSALIVVFPVFIALAWHVARTVAADPTRRASKVRQATTYFALFIASLVVIGDVTALVYNVLGGELTLRFLLKVGTVAAIAGAVFAYYVGQLRADARETAA